ncbi:MAG TPA: cupin domain-containing protein [Ignavibacteria bacterium]|nr:cupin domain-containing protein [Ignavibacteria bacterium]
MDTENNQQKSAEVNVAKLSDEIQYQDSGIVSKQLIKKTNGNITLFAFDKGESLTEHTSSFDAVAQVIEGEMEFTIGGKLYEVKGGEYINLPANIPHSLSAKEKNKMLLIMIK